MHDEETAENLVQGLMRIAHQLQNQRENADLRPSLLETAALIIDAADDVLTAAKAAGDTLPHREIEALDRAFVKPQVIASKLAQHQALLKVEEVVAKMAADTRTALADLSNRLGKLIDQKHIKMLGERFEAVEAQQKRLLDRVDEVRAHVRTATDVREHHEVVQEQKADARDEALRELKAQIAELRERLERKAAPKPKKKKPAIVETKGEPVVVLLPSEDEQTNAETPAAPSSIDDDHGSPSDAVGK